jgi:hypothetical protein
MLARTFAGVFVAGWALLATHPSCFGQDVATAADHDPKTVCRQIVDGYRANRDALGAFTCRFKYKMGKAASLDDAKNGKIKSNFEGDGLWIVDGPRTRYLFVTTMAKPGKLAAPVVERGLGEQTVMRVETVGVNESYLENKEVRASQSRRLIKLKRAKGLESEPTMMPFSLGMNGGLTTLWQGVADGRQDAHVDRAIEENGNSLLALSWGPKGQPPQLLYQVDPKRSYLPIHFGAIDPATRKWKIEASILELKDCGSGRWFPMRGLVVAGAKEDPWPRNVQELRVTELNLERPDDQEFALDVPAQTRIFDSVSRQQGVIEKESRLHESQLTSFFNAPPAN